MANVKKALIGDNRDLVDPYVQVQFAGQKVSQLCWMLNVSVVVIHFSLKKNKTWCSWAACSFGEAVMVSHNQTDWQEFLDASLITHIYLILAQWHMQPLCY